MVAVQLTIGKSVEIICYEMYARNPYTFRFESLTQMNIHVFIDRIPELGLNSKQNQTYSFSFTPIASQQFDIYLV